MYYNDYFTHDSPLRVKTILFFNINTLFRDISLYSDSLLKKKSLIQFEITMGI